MNQIRISCLCIVMLVFCVPIASNAGDQDSDLIKMAEKGRFESVQQLLVNGVSVNAVDGKGRTALMLAAEKGYNNIVELLLTNGANVELKDKKGESALDKAKNKKRQEVIELLELKSANSIKSYKRFIEDHENSPLVAKARIAIDSINWEKASGKNTLASYWTYMHEDDPKQFIELAKIRFDQKLQMATSIEIGSILASITRVIAPYTLKDISSTISSANSSQLNFGGISIESSSKQRIDSDTNYTVTMKRVLRDGKLIKVDFFAKKGRVSPLDMYNGDIGDEVLSLFASTPKSTDNPVGFETVDFFSGDLRGGYLVTGGKAYSL